MLCLIFEFCFIYLITPLISLLSILTYVICNKSSLFIYFLYFHQNIPYCLTFFSIVQMDLNAFSPFYSVSVVIFFFYYFLQIFKVKFMYSYGYLGLVPLVSFCTFHFKIFWISDIIQNLSYISSYIFTLFPLLLNGNYYLI